ncbi:hypothetical protein KHM83_12935 [Fusibacter paucivorans]|uniref:Uncharacterized protein n=1 Tax=Fusibacter paucivorans TaxID=76009 RepID=A0ABS5PR88_9FIRM|nr:hypothetical protein [Fusibacter paucivorans]MBS7527583.1 hypothetical protein [Fusibacter paucivorans]
MTERKKAEKPRSMQTLYALSIHMKYGEVLHVEGIDREERDQYLALAKAAGSTMLLETKHEVRQLRSDDIAKVSIISYNANYINTWHLAKRMLLGESSIGRWIFGFMIKFFVFLCFVIAIAQLGLRVIDGTIMDVLFDPTQFVAVIDAALVQMKTVFNYVVVFMILLHLLDMVLALRNDYYINQDGAPWVEQTTAANFILTGGLIVGFFVVKAVIGGVMAML